MHQVILESRSPTLSEVAFIPPGSGSCVRSQRSASTNILGLHRAWVYIRLGFDAKRCLVMNDGVGWPTPSVKLQFSVYQNSFEPTSS